MTEQSITETPFGNYVSTTSSAWSWLGIFEVFLRRLSLRPPPPSPNASLFWSFMGLVHKNNIEHQQTYTFSAAWRPSVSWTERKRGLERLQVRGAGLDHRLSLYSKYLFLSAHHRLQIVVHKSELLLQLPHSPEGVSWDVGGERGTVGRVAIKQQQTVTGPIQEGWCLQACMTYKHTWDSNMATRSSE